MLIATPYPPVAEYLIGIAGGHAAALLALYFSVVRRWRPAIGCAIATMIWAAICMWVSSDVWGGPTPIGYAIIGSPIVPAAVAVVMALALRGRKPLTGRRRRNTVSIFVGLLCALFLGTWYVIHEQYYGERDRLIEHFKTFPQVTDVSVDGHDDGWFICEYVRFRIAGKPGSLIVLEVDGPESAEFQESIPSLSLQRLGPWKFHVQDTETVAGQPPYTYSEDSIDIGLEGEFVGKMPFKVSSLADLCQRYDDLVRHFATWPTPQAPGILQLHGASRDDTLTYWAVKAESNK